MQESIFCGSNNQEMTYLIHFFLDTQRKRKRKRYENWFSMNLLSFFIYFKEL